MIDTDEPDAVVVLDHLGGEPDPVSMAVAGYAIGVWHLRRDIAFVLDARTSGAREIACQRLVLHIARRVRMVPRRIRLLACAPDDRRVHLCPRPERAGYVFLYPARFGSHTTACGCLTGQALLRATLHSVVHDLDAHLLGLACAPHDAGFIARHDALVRSCLRTVRGTMGSGQRRAY